MRMDLGTRDHNATNGLRRDGWRFAWCFFARRLALDFAWVGLRVTRGSTGDQNRLYRVLRQHPFVNAQHHRLTTAVFSTIFGVLAQAS